MSSYIDVFKSFGINALLIELSNSVLSRLGIVKIERLYKLEKLDVVESLVSNIEVKQLEFSMLENLSSDDKHAFSAEDLYRLKAGKVACFGAFYNDIFVGLGWYALEAYHHGSGIYACFSDDWICGYGAWVHPEHRGLGIRKLIVAAAMSYAKSIGRAGIIAAIDWNNFPSIRSGEKIGYQYIGLRYWNKRKPFKQRDTYWHTWPHKSLSATGFEKPHAFITPFVTPVLDVSFSTGNLALVVDCGNSNIESWCAKRNIPYVKYNANNPQSIVHELQRLQAKFLISYAAPLLTSDVFTAPEYGTFNIHPSMLPMYRGGLPVFWQAFDGVTHSGVSIHSVDQGIDTGKVLLNKEIKLPEATNKTRLTNIFRRNSASLLNNFLYTYKFDGQPCDGYKEVTKTSRFANNVTLKKLLESTPVSHMTLLELYRLTQYIGSWSSLLGEPPKSYRWYPLYVSKMVADDEINKMGFYILGNELRFGTNEGFLVIEKSKSIRGIIKTAKSILLKPSFKADVYL